MTLRAAAAARAAAADAAPGTPAAPARHGHAPLALGALTDIVGYHLAQAAVVTRDTFERHVGQPYTLRRVEYSLLLLLRANGPLSPKRLGHTLALSAPMLTLLLDRLQERGLLRRERSETDRRSQNIVLTDAGRVLAERTEALVEPMERELLDRLSPAERMMLIELLRKVAGR